MKRNTLTTAVLAGLTGVAGMASVANAVNVNPDGLGQVLLYPYYSARGGNDTLISIVNTTENGKAVKIRFIEALNSREVLDFNIYMSAFDVWTAGVTAEGDGAKMLTFDTTCTAPYFQGGTPGEAGEQDFLTLEFDDGGPTGADRTKSGYIEVIEMGELTGDAAAAADHGSDGVPGASGTTGTGVCGLFQERWISGSKANGTGVWLEGDQQTDIDPPAGGLFGAGSLIDVGAGTMVTYNATAIDGFWDGSQGEHTDPGSLFPSLSEGSVNTSNVFVNGQVSTVQWGSSIFAVNAALTVDSLMNEYVTDPSVGANSEWVVTFPTKRFHVNGAQVIDPFTQIWDPANGLFACDQIDLSVYNREEQTPSPDTGGVPVSPKPDTEEEVFELCREANVVRFASDDSLPAEAPITGEPSSEVTAAPEWGYVNFEVPFTSGWAEFDFDNFTSEPSNDGTEEVVGLPAIGFWANTFTNDAVAEGVLANYGGSFNHRGSRSFPQSAE